MAFVDQERAVHGPYYRLASETQDADAMVKQLLSGELWLPSKNLLIDGKLGIAKLKIAIVLVTQSLHAHAP